MLISTFFAGKSGLMERHRLVSRTRAPRTAKALTFVLSGFLVAALFWANRTEVQELARAEGEIVPSGRLLQVEHYDGGVIEEVLVRQGDRVHEGDVLARLSSPSLGENAAELRQDAALLEARRDMLQALLDDEAEHPLEDAYAAARRELHRSRTELLGQRVAARQEALDLARSTRVNAEERVTLATTELKRLEQLQRKGLMPTSRISEQQDMVQAVRGDLLGATTNLAGAVAAHADAAAAIQEGDLAYRQELQGELFETRQKLERVTAQIDELKARRERLTVTAPEAGIVQLAASTSAGEVVDAGEKMFEILPSSARLIAEIRLTPNDIGHVGEGDAVSIKPTAFDARRYGDISGTITRISPTSVLDPEGRPYFNAVVELETIVLSRGPSRGEISPGMVVAAEIATGQRTVLEYLLKPIDRSLEMSLSER